MNKWTASLCVLIACMLLVCPGCSRETPQPEETDVAVNGVEPLPTEEPAPDPGPSDEVFVQVMVDREFAEPLLRQFEENTGITVHARFAEEAGLLFTVTDNELRPVPNGVIWSDDALTTVALADRGELEATQAALERQPLWGSAEAGWYGFAPRARVLAYSPQRVGAEELPAFWLDLAHPRFAGRLAMADLTSETARAHITAWFLVYGEIMARDFLEQLAEHGLLRVADNTVAVRLLLDGEVDFAITDSDAVWEARDRGASIEMLALRHTGLPGGGALLMPMTVARQAHTRNAEAADRLIAFLLSAEVERELAQSDARYLATHPALQAEFDPSFADDLLVISPEEMFDMKQRALRIGEEALSR